jgi:SulP family sulfate permease
VSDIVVLATVAVTVATHDLSMGVVVGVLLSGVFFAFKVTRLMDVQVSHDAATDTRIYTVYGQIDDVVSKMRRHGMVIGLNQANAVLVDRHAPLLRDPPAAAA